MATLVDFGDSNLINVIHREATPTHPRTNHYQWET